jgi:hypothetical protein
MTAAIEDAQLGTLTCSDGGEKVRSFELGCPNLEVRVARSAERPRPQERAAEIGAAAALARQHALRRVLEWPMRGVEHAGPVQGLVSVRRPFDVQLVAGRTVEGMLLVRPDLRLDIEGTQECERATCHCRAREIEVQGNLASTPQVHASGNVEQSGELGEAIAIRIRRDLRELIAQIFRE